VNCEEILLERADLLKDNFLMVCR